jgi:hypothetical protein
MTESQYKIYKKNQGMTKIRELSEINDSVILFSSVSALSIVIYTSVPHIQASRIVSGCLTYFTKDKIAVYLACVLKQMRQSNTIFKSVSKMREQNIIDAINKTMNDMISYELSKNLIGVFETTNQETVVNPNNSNSIWQRFLPYQLNGKKYDISDLSLSYSLQALIQEMVNLEVPLLMTKSKKTFLENTCCVSLVEDNNENLVLKYFIENDKKNRLLPVVENINKLYPKNIYCCDKDISPSFNTDKTKWVNPIQTLITSRIINKDVHIIINPHILPKITLNNSPEWVKQLNKYINGKIKHEDMMNSLFETMNSNINNLYESFKNNDQGKINIDSWIKKSNISQVNIMLWKDIAIYCSIVLPFTMGNNKSPDKVKIIENTKWKVKHWKLSDKHYVDIQTFVSKNILKYKAWYETNKIAKSVKNIFSMDFWKWLQYIIQSNIITNNEIIHYICIDVILDSFVAFVKIDSNAVYLVKTLITSLNEIRKYVLKTEKELEDALFKLAQAEKNLITDRLKAMGEEERKLDNVMKNLQLGDWSIGQMKGLREYDTSFYDKERVFVDAINKSVNADNNDVEL